MTNNQNSNVLSAGMYLAVIQFLFAICWLVYIIYLGELLEKVGIGKEYVIWFIFADQLIFAFMDAALGFNADKIGKVIGKLGPWIIGINAISCISFALLPIASEQTHPAIFIVLVFLWVSSASVLRAPPLVLLSKYASKPKIPWLVSLSLAGLAIGGALSPYLGFWLKQQDPLLPFMIAAATLWLTTLGLIWVERSLPKQQQAEQTDKPSPDLGSRFKLLIFAALCLGLGFQIYFFLNTKPQFLSHISKDQLMLYLPLFWVGFNLLVFPGASWASKRGAFPVLSFAVLLLVIGGFITSFASDSINGLIVGQLLTGGAWGVIFMAGITASLKLGSTGKEGMVLGLWFSMLSLAAVIRVGMVIGGAKDTPEYMAISSYIPPILWLIGLLSLVWIAIQMRKQQKLRSFDLLKRR